MTTFHKGEEVEVRARPHMAIKANQWVKGTVEHAGSILSLVLFDDGSCGVFRNTDIRAIEQMKDRS